MADVLPSVPQSGGIQNVLALIQSLGPMFGSGKATTTTEGSTSTASSTSRGALDPTASAQADELLKSILGQNDSGDLDKMIGNILTRAKQEFAPTLGKSLGAGERSYSSTALTQLGNEAMARATAEAAATKLNFINKNNSVAAQIVDRKLAETSTKTNEQVTTTPTRIATQQTGATPTGKALSYAGPALYAYNLLKDNKKKTPPPGASELFSSGGSPAGTFDITNAFNAANPETASFMAANPSLNASTILNADAGVPEFGFKTLFDAGSTDTFGAISSMVSDPILFTDAASIASDATAATATTATDVGATTTAAGDVATGGGADVTGDIGGVAAGAAGADFLSGVGAASAIGPIEAAGIAEAGGVFGAGELAAGAAEFGIADLAPALLWVICTELKSTGELDAKLYAEGAKHISSLPSEVIRGYHLWAVPYTKWMRKNKFARAIAKPVAIGRANQLAGNWNLLGWFTVILGEPVCGLIGKFCKEQDPMSLYPRSF